MRSSRSKTATVWPARVSCWAAASPAGPDPTTATVLPVSRSGGCGHETVGERLVDDRDLDLLDRDGRLVDSEHTRRLARRRAQPTRELGEVVCGMQAFAGLAALVTPREVVPLRNQVAEGATLVAERNTAVHTTAGLFAYCCRVTLFVDLFPVHKTQSNGAARRGFTFRYLQESLGISHRSPPRFCSRPRRRRGRAPRRSRIAVSRAPRRNRAVQL